jgi:hypothetical protein
MIRARSAFTLVETLVVVVIIIIMAAFLLPVLSREREKSRQATCISNQRQLGLALSMAVQDNQEVFPGKMGVADGALWQKELQPYADSAKLWRCPSSIDERSAADYGMNFFLSGMPRGALTDPSRLLMLADANDLLIQTQGDVAARRHAGQYIVTCADNHSTTLAADSDVIFASGDQGTILCFYPEYTPIAFSSGKDAKGRSSSMVEGGVVVLTNDTQAAVLPRVTVTGGDTAPAQGLIPGVSDLQISPGQSRAFSLYCRLDSSSGTKAQTIYTFGEYPHTVTIYVSEPVVVKNAYPGF